VVSALTALAASGVFLPKRLPSERKFGFASRETSASALVANSTFFTLSSAASNGVSWSKLRRSTLGATQTRRDNGLPYSDAGLLPRGAAEP